MPNKIKLPRPTFYRTTRDIVCRRDGVPATVEKGSYVLAGDPLHVEYPDDLEAV